MKSTGVVRRVDQLGRIVIPKEIRKNLRIREEDNLEIFVENESIILKKYSLFSRLGKAIEGLTDVVNQVMSKHIFITDMEKIISCNSQLFSYYDGQELNERYIKLIEKRDTYVAQELSNLQVTNREEKDKYYILVPIIINGEVLGSIFMFSYEDAINDKDKLIINFILKYLEKNIED